MFELCCLRCEYAELHAPSSFGLDKLLIALIVPLINNHHGGEKQSGHVRLDLAMPN